jgi:alpha-tubulin suppressor-like RCC1 family protein
MVGLKADGTAVAVGDMNHLWGQCSVSDWTDIVQVAAGLFHTLGLKADGTVVAAGPGVEVTKWDLF